MSPLLTESEASAYLRELGVDQSPRTLSNKRWSGDGPLFLKIKHRVRYRKPDLEAWALAQISEPRLSTSDRPKVGA